MSVIREDLLALSKIGLARASDMLAGVADDRLAIGCVRKAAELALAAQKVQELIQHIDRVERLMREIETKKHFYTPPPKED